jgi:hypothetical protein
MMAGQLDNGNYVQQPPERAPKLLLLLLISLRVCSKGE